MSSEADKAVLELAVFGEFAAKTTLTVTKGSAQKQAGESEPDILCNIEGEGTVAFELVQLCSGSLVALAKQGEAGVKVLSVSDSSIETVRKKLHKKYRSNAPVELLCYTNGALILPDNVVLSKIRPWFDAEGPFRRAWFLGEKSLYEVWRAS